MQGDRCCAGRFCGADRVALKITVLADGDEADDEHDLDDDAASVRVVRETVALHGVPEPPPVPKRKRRWRALLSILAILVTVGGGLIYAGKRADGLQARN